MKQRILILLVATALLLALTACTGDQAQNPSVTTNPTEESTMGTTEATLPSFEAEEPVLKGDVYQITEPIIEPFRQLLWKIPGLQGFPLDLSFLAAYITLNILMEIL